MRAAARAAMDPKNMSPNAELFQYLDAMVHQLEAADGGLDLDLREKIAALHAETVKIPSVSISEMNQIEIESELDRLSGKLASIDKKIAELACDPEVKQLLEESASLWMPVVTSTVEERREVLSERSGKQPKQTFEQDLHEPGK